jgi:prepilin peptidase CpaA
MPTPEPALIAAYTAFTAALAVAAMSDIRTRRIPNVVVGPLLVAGIGVGGALGGPNGVASSFAAAAVGLAIWLPLYLLRAMGAGDVKFFAGRFGVAQRARRR